MHIRQATSSEDYAAVVTLQSTVWGAGSAIVPVPLLIAASHAGGCVLVAVDPESGTYAGFCFGFVGLDTHVEPPEPILWSHMLAVDPGYRGQGIGRDLKLAQAELSRQRGLKRVLWTFDPLESRNAHLNLVGLGTIASRYLTDHYGPMNDALNAGLASDRLVADWRLDQPDASAVRADNQARLLNPNAPEVDTELVITDEDEHLRICVPAGAWREDAAGAQAWRANVRSAFLAAFDAGFIAEHFHIEGDRGFYHLVRS